MEVGTGTHIQTLTFLLIDCGIPRSFSFLTCPSEDLFGIYCLSG